MNRFHLISSILLALVLTMAASAAEQAGFEQTMKPFLKEHCTRCHGAEKQKGDFRIDTLEADFADLGKAQRWAEVVFRLNSGEMPQKKPGK
jgi:mono/diheme cytochrome c family protein